MVSSAVGPVVPLYKLDIRPSLSRSCQASLTAKLSERGMFKCPSISVPLSSSDAATETRPDMSSAPMTGFAEMTLSAPVSVFLPNSVPCGPLRTSTLSTSNIPVLN